MKIAQTDKTRDTVKSLKTMKEKMNHFSYFKIKNKT